MRFTRARTLVFAALCGGFAAAGVTAATALTGDDSRPSTPDGTPVRATSKISGGARSAATGADYKVQVYTTASGASCFQWGEERDGRVGIARPDGTFLVREPEAGANCVPVGTLSEKTPVVASVTSTPDETVVYGLVAPTVTALELRLDGRQLNIRPSASKSFIAVVDGAVASGTVLARSGGASTVSQALAIAPPPPKVTPPPVGTGGHTHNEHSG